MKKIVFILISTVCLLGCSGFLDTNNLTEKNSSNFPNNETDMSSILASAYAATIEVPNNAGKWQITPLIAEVMADYTLSGGGQGDRHVRAISEYKKSGVNMYSELWRRYYSGIHRTNFIFESVERIAWSDEVTKNQILGQAHFLRAHFYFDLVRLFEHIPLVVSTIPENKFQAEPDEVYALIFSDLKAAIELLPATPITSIQKSELGHATRWAAEGLMGRAYLFYSGFYKKEHLGLADGTQLDRSAVKGYIDDCIAHSGHDLIPDFRNLWPYAYSNKDYAYSKTNNLEWIGEDGANIETVFAYKYSTLGGASALSYCNNLDLYYGLRGQETLPFAKGWGWGTVNPKLYDEWSDADVRKKGTILSVTDASEGVSYKWNANRNYYETGYFNKKYMPINVRNAENKLVNYSCVLYGVTPHFQYNNTQDVVILRFADILLMGAELGCDNAQAYFDRVRMRAKLPSVPVTLQEIKNERLHELAFEGIRYYDLMRWGDVEKEVNRMQQAVPVKTMGVAQNYSSTFRTETRGFLPIPEDEIQLSNGVLKQNVGWDTPDAFYQD